MLLFASLQRVRQDDLYHRHHINSKSSGRYLPQCQRKPDLHFRTGYTRYSHHSGELSIQLNTSCGFFQLKVTGPPSDIAGKNIMATRYKSPLMDSNGGNWNEEASPMKLFTESHDEASTRGLSSTNWMHWVRSHFDGKFGNHSHTGQC